jgi:hypothetical protein
MYVMVHNVLIQIKIKQSFHHISFPYYKTIMEFPHY